MPSSRPPPFSPAAPLGAGRAVCLGPEGSEPSLSGAPPGAVVGWRASRELGTPDLE